MRDVEINSSAIAAACPEKTASSSFGAWIRRLLKRKRNNHVLSEHSPEYLLRDVGLKEGRPSCFDRDGHKLPEWK